MADVEFITESGLKSAKKAANHEIDGFLESVYFKEEVLKRYESNKDFRIGDNGTVLFGDQWGLFRGVFRVAKGYIAANLGDLGEGFPNEELEYWKQYNVDYSEIKIEERYFDFRSEIKRIIYFMNQSNQMMQHYVDKYFSEVNVIDRNIFLLDDAESVLNNIKKVINDKTTVDEFQSRVMFLNILLVESINTELLNKIFEEISEDLKLSYVSLGIQEVHRKHLRKNTPIKLMNYLKGSIQPLKSLELLRKFLLFMRIHYGVTVTKKIRTLADFKRRRRKIHKTIQEEFYLFYRYGAFNEDFQNRKYFEHHENKINNDTSFLKLLNKFRNSSSAHGFNSKEYKKILRRLRIDETEKDFSKVFEILIRQVSYDIQHIFYNLILPGPPMREHYVKYVGGSLSDFSSPGKTYQLVFEDLISYLHEFPELYPKIIKTVKKEYQKKNNDQKFIVELGSFIESLSYIIKDRSQKLVNYLIPGIKYEKALTIAHFAHIIKNSNEISANFLKKILPIVFEGIKDKKTTNVSFCSEHVIFCLIEKCPEKLNKRKIKSIFKDKKITFEPIKEYIAN